MQCLRRLQAFLVDGSLEAREVTWMEDSSTSLLPTLRIDETAQLATCSTDKRKRIAAASFVLREALAEARVHASAEPLLDACRFAVVATVPSEQIEKALSLVRRIRSRQLQQIVQTNTAWTVLSNSRSFEIARRRAVAVKVPFSIVEEAQRQFGCLELEQRLLEAVRGYDVKKIDRLRIACQNSGVRADAIALAKRTAADLREDALWGALCICKGQGKRNVCGKSKGKGQGKQAIDWNIDASDLMAEACRLSEPRECFGAGVNPQVINQIREEIPHLGALRLDDGSIDSSDDEAVKGKGKECNGKGKEGKGRQLLKNAFESLVYSGGGAREGKGRGKHAALNTFSPFPHEWAVKGEGKGGCTLA